MMRYTDAGSLLIVGNRTKAHFTALKAGAAVFITGGFEASDMLKKSADELELPIISTSYDTFTVATMINRAIYDQLIKKEILFIEDIYVPYQETDFLKVTDEVKSYHDQNALTTHGGFPVIDANQKLVGIVTARDVIGIDHNESIEKIMTKNPLTVSMKTSVATAGHRMIWEGIDLMPVVNDAGNLEGVISRQDVLKALQLAQRQPQHGETIDDIVKSQMKVLDENDLAVEFTVTPQMTNQFGAISYGAFTTLLAEVGNHVLKKNKRGDSVAENMTIYFIKPMQMDSVITVKPSILDMSRKFVKMEFDVYQSTLLVGKAMMMFQLLER